MPGKRLGWMSGGGGWCWGALLAGTLLFPLSATGMAAAEPGAEARQLDPTAPTDLSGRTIQQIILVSDGPLRKVRISDLRKLLELREGESYDPSAARNSIQRLYSTNLFYDIQLSAQLTEGGRVDLKVVLIRRYLVGAVRFLGKIGLEEGELRRVSRTRVGEPFHPQSIQDTLSELVTLYRTHGYYRARTLVNYRLDEQEALVRVDFQIEPGEPAWVRELQFDIEGSMDPAELQALMKTRLSGRYSEVQKDQDVELLETHLRRQGYLSPQVYVRGGAQYDPEANQVSLVFRIVPGSRTEIRFEGDPPDEDVLLRTPLFSEGGSAEIFLEETVALLREELQGKGYYFADVRFERVPQAGAAAAIVFRIEAGNRFSISRVDIVGNEFFSSQDLLGVIRVRRPGFLGRGRFTESTVEQDLRSIESLYQNQGFLEVEADYQLVQESADRVRVTFQVNEGARYTVESVEVEGNEILPSEVLRNEMRAAAGRPYSPLMIAQDRTSITALYEARGYRQVDFHSSVNHLPGRRVALVYSITEGGQSLVDSVLVTGNRITRDSVVRREIRLEAGAPLSLDGILRTETNLYNLAVFSRVQIRENPSFSDPFKKTVLINLEESRRYTLLYGIGYSTFEGPRGTLGITNNNLQGKARPLSLNLRVSKQRQRGGFTYALPRLLEGRLPTLLSFTADNELAQTAKTSGLSRAIRGKPFDSFRLIASSQSERVLSRRESLFFRYEYEQIQSNVPEGLKAPLEFFREEERVRLSSVSVSYLNESRTDPADPQGGFFLSGDVKTSNRILGSQEELIRVFTQGQYYRELRPSVIWVASLRTGIVAPYGRTSSVPISEHYFSGGSTTLRGLPHELAGPLLEKEDGTVFLVDEEGNEDPEGRAVPLGGEALLLFNTEVRFPIFGFLRGTLFYDVGNVFEKISTISLENLSQAAGFGFHFRTPVGPVRLDVGYNPNPPDVKGFEPWNFYITLGHPF